MPFRDAWLPVGVLLIFVGLAAGAGIIVAVGLAVVAIGGIARFWSQHLFDRVFVQTRVSETRVFSGEPVKLDVTIENRKVLPLPWFRWRLGVSDSLHVEGEPLLAQALAGLSWLHRRGTIGWFEHQEWHFTITSEERGYHQVGPVTLRSADLFGLLPRSFPVPELRHVIVYPEAPPLASFDTPADRPLGSFKGRNRLFEDPVRIRGLREYRPGDPLKRIDWKATARRGELQSRVYEASAEPQLYILMNIDTMEHSGQGYFKEELERTISLAASVAVWAGERRYAVGLLANGSYPDADRPIRLAPSRSREQVPRILEALAVIQPLTMGDLASALSRETSRIPAGSTIIVVAALIQEALAAAIMRLRSEQSQVTVLGTSDRVDATLLGDTPVIMAAQRFASAGRT